MNDTFKRYLMFAGPWTFGTVALVTLLMEPLEEFWVSFAISVFIGEICMAGCYWGSYLIGAAIEWFHKLKGWQYKERSRSASALHGVAFMLPSLFFALERMAVIGPRFGIAWKTPSIDNYKYGIVFGLFSTLVYVAWDLSRAKRESDQAIQNLESANLKAQVAALTAQMNPHLLFNSLNSIASMIHENPASAEQMTVELSSLYRRVLAAVKQERHSLEAELGLCRSYLEIEKARFGDRLKYDIGLDKEIQPDQLMVPVLCVQPFVENAVKHGLLTQVEGGTLHIVALVRDGFLYVSVKDDGVGFGKAPASKGSGTAIANCEERLRMMYGDEASLTIRPGDPGTTVVLKMPAHKGTAK